MDKKITYYYYDASSKNPVRVLDAGYHKTTGGRNSSQKMLDHYVLHCVIKGKGVYRIYDNLFRLSEGDCFLLPPDVPLLYQSDPHDPWVYYWIGIDGIDVDQLMLLCGFGNFRPILHYDNINELVSHIKPLVDKQETTLADSYYAISEFYNLCSCLIRENKKERTLSRKENYVEQAQAIIRDTYYKNQSVSDIAKQIGLDRTYLYRIFQATTGKSIQQYINDLRISRATYYLKQTELSISEIAFYCGYKSESYFSIAFHKAYGISPSNYRKAKK